MLVIVAMLVVAIVVLIMAAMRPNEFSVKRSIGIRAPADGSFRSSSTSGSGRRGRHGKRSTPT